MPVVQRYTRSTDRRQRFHGLRGVSYRWYDLILTSGILNVTHRMPIHEDRLPGVPEAKRCRPGPTGKTSPPKLKPHSYPASNLTDSTPTTPSPAGPGPNQGRAAFRTEAVVLIGT